MGKREFIRFWVKMSFGRISYITQSLWSLSVGYDSQAMHISNVESHYIHVVMSAIASQITSLKIVYSTVYSGADQRKHQSSASLAFVRAIHRWPVNSQHKWPVTRKMFPYDDVVIWCSTIRSRDLYSCLLGTFLDVAHGTYSIYGDRNKLCRSYFQTHFLK